MLSEVWVSVGYWNWVEAHVCVCMCVCLYGYTVTVINNSYSSYPWNDYHLYKETSQHNTDEQQDIVESYR